MKIKLPVDCRGGAILRRLPALNPVVVEVGVFVATLSRYLLIRRPDLNLIMVDNWAGEEDQPAAYRATNDRHAHCTRESAIKFRLETKANIYRYRDRAKVMAMSSIVAADQISDSTIDLVFIDADHSYEGASADIRAWVPKVKNGGFIGGHDYGETSTGFDFPGVTQAVDEFSNGRKLELDEDSTWFCRINA